MNIYSDEGKWHVWDGITNSVFDTEDQAHWFVRTGQTASAAEAARSISKMASTTTEFSAMRANTRAMFDAQQSIFAAIRLAVLRGQIAIDAAGNVTTTLTDEQIAEIGLDRSVFLSGLVSLNTVLSSVGAADSAAIATFMK